MGKTSRERTALPKININEFLKRCNFSIGDDGVENTKLIFQTIVKYPKGLNFGEIAKKTKLSKRTISKRLKLFKEKGLIKTNTLVSKKIKLYSLKI